MEAGLEWSSVAVVWLQSIVQVKELDDKNGVKDDVVGRIVRAKNQRAMVDCTDANNNTPLSEAASQYSHVPHV